MGLIQSAKLNGRDFYAYREDVLQRVPTRKNHLMAGLLLHRWQPLNFWRLVRHLRDSVNRCLLRAYHVNTRNGCRAIDGAKGPSV